MSLNYSDYEELLKFWKQEVSNFDSYPWYNITDDYYSLTNDSDFPADLLPTRDPDTSTPTLDPDTSTVLFLEIEPTPRQEDSLEFEDQTDSTIRWSYF